MFLFTKSILKERELGDGIRISVMSRHTLQDGITPDLRITPDKFDEWLRELAPHPRLVGDYYKRGLPWEQFEFRYPAQIRSRESIDLVRLLAEECLIYNPTLRVEHR